LRQGCERTGVEVQAYDGEYEGGHEDWNRSHVQRSDQRDGDEDSAQQKPHDPDLQVRGGVVDGPPVCDPAPGQRPDQAARDQHDPG